ncbi:MAG: hypothetical protein ACREH8_10120, partial [Opitutaceae bacterium]
LVACAVVASDASAQQMPETILRQRVLSLLLDQHAPPLTPGTGGAPLKYIGLLEMGQKAGFDRSRMQSLLLEFAEQGLLAARPPDAETAAHWADTGKSPANVRYGQAMAQGALGVLRYIGDAFAIERLTHLAEAAPSPLESTAVMAVVDTVCREAPDDILQVSRQLAANRTYTSLFTALRDILQARAEVDGPTPSSNSELILQAVLEGLRNPNYEDRISLDRTLDEFSPAFRQSAERRQILRELSASSNPNVKRYAEAKLKELPPTPALARDGPATPPVTKKVPSPADVGQPAPPSGAATAAGVSPLFLGGLAVLGAVAWLVWRVSTRH